MTHDEQKRIIAEFEGWKPPVPNAKPFWANCDDAEIRCIYCGCHFCDCSKSLQPPSYPTDENEIRRVWRGLAKDIKNEAMAYLCILIGKHSGCDTFTIEELEKVSDATAEQLCEALIRALNKWVETPLPDAPKGDSLPGVNS